MSFAPAKLAVLAYSNGFTLWHYDTEDNAQQLVSPNYFGPAAGTLRRGDLVFSSWMLSGAKKTGLLLVTAVADESVTVEALYSGAVDNLYGLLTAAQTRSLALGNLRDVTANDPMRGEILRYDGNTWGNAAESGAVGDTFAASHPASGGNAHPAATIAEAGFLSATDKQKLDSVAANAAPNPALASADEVLSGSVADPRLFSPAQVKTAILTHAPSVAIDSVDNTKLANMAASRLKGRLTGTGDPQDLTAAQVRTLLNVQDGATAAGSAGDAHAVTSGNPHGTTAAQVGAIALAEKGTAGGVATLDGDGKVSQAQLPPPPTYTTEQITDTQAKVIMTAAERGKLAGIEARATAAGTAGDTHAVTSGNPHGTTAAQVGAIALAEKGTAGGVATLDGDGKVSQAQLPPPPTYTTEQITDTQAKVIMTAAERGKLAGIEARATAAGSAGDAHAVTSGNPHGTTAAQVGAVAVTEKGSAGGVATLNAAGKVPTAQLPPGTTIVTYNEFFATDYVDPSNSAAVNDAKFDELWAAVRASSADRIKITFRGGGNYAISATVSPSGKGYGIGANCWDPRILCIDWADTRLVVNSSNISRFMEIRRGSGEGQPLNNFQRFGGGGADPCPNDGRFYDAQGSAVPKRVVFNARYQGSIKMVGRLSIRQNSRAPHLWAFGSTGGLDADAPRSEDVGGYMWRNADVDHIVALNFEGGIHAAHYNAEQVDSLTRCHIRKFEFVGDSVVFADSNTLDGCVWDHFGGRLENTTYITGCPIFTVNAGFFAIATPAGFSKSVIVIANSQVRWNSYVHLNNGSFGGDADAWACWHLADNGRLIMDQMHQDTGVVYGSKASIYVGPDYNGNACSNQVLKIGSLSKNCNFDGQTAVDQRNVVALDCSSNQANKGRQIVFDTWNNLGGPTPKWRPVYAYKSGTSYATSSTDSIRVNFSTGWRQYRFDSTGSEVNF